MGVNAPKSQGYSVLTTVFVITAFILMWIGSLRCNFIKFPSTSGNSGDASMELGIWYFQWISFVYSAGSTYAFESCHGYPSTVSMDGVWKTAQAFSVIAFIFGIIMVVVACVGACASSRDTGYARTYVWEAPGYMLTALCQGLTLLMLSSSACSSGVITQLFPNYPAILALPFAETCSMATGAKLAISSLSFWFAAAVTSYLAHRTEKAEMAEGTDAGLSEPLASSEGA